MLAPPTSSPSTRLVSNDIAAATCPGTQEQKQVLPVQSPAPPKQLLCPITLKLMNDPVITMDGHTYERAAILEVFRVCKANGQPLRSPVTRELLPSKLLVENVAIRSQCREHQE